MSKINRLPRGLQDALGSKSVGRNPSELLNDVRPTVDLTQFWLASIPWETVRTTEAVTAAGTFAAVEVPQNQIWLVSAVNCAMINGNNSVFSFAIGFTSVVLAGVVRVNTTISDSINHLAVPPFPLGTSAIIAAPNMPIVARAGDRFQVDVSQITTPLHTARTDVTFKPLLV